MTRKNNVSLNAKKVEMIIFKPTMLSIITRNFTKFKYTLHAPQVKRNLISIIKSLIQE